jgi:hypothetical protein
MDDDSGRQDQNALKLLRMVTIPGPLTQKDLYHDWQLFLKFRYENFIKKEK